jgi:hypothetical protein
MESVDDNFKPFSGSIGLVGQPLLAVPHSLSVAEADSQEWLSYWNRKLAHQREPAKAQTPNLVNRKRKSSIKGQVLECESDSARLYA